MLPRKRLEMPLNSLEVLRLNLVRETKEQKKHKYGDRVLILLNFVFFFLSHIVSNKNSG